MPGVHVGLHWAKVRFFSKHEWPESMQQLLETQFSVVFAHKSLAHEATLGAGAWPGVRPPSRKQLQGRLSVSVTSTPFTQLGLQLAQVMFF
mmetsp:Transcript_28140/g.55261  ORF Transcript_28140/g.55261 Transcript_28140/m.55261 type:complete len:91 (+) Transcript_28140:1120-1392(+)